ncbi:MAG TPA: TonB-dependent receptor [Holophagaceae bacterium]|jgi:hypothetical protein|nr:TonB-dependent receptor [Holophagaceae bacterium]
MRLTRICFAIALAGPAVMAQSLTTGAVSGKIVDGAGKPVAGATVTFTSGQTSISIPSAADGTFRRGLLNPGEWTVTVTKDGFSTSKASVAVAPNDTRAVNIRLAMVAEQTVDIVGATQTIDTNTTTTGLSQSLETLSSVPKSRNMTDLAFLSPNVTDDGGFGNPSIAGASGAENKYYLDGLQTTDERTGFQGASLPTDFIDQFSVQTGALSPEYSALGGVFSAVTKQGTNDFKGEVFAYDEPAGFKAKPKSNLPYFKAGDNTTQYDYGFTVSGPIVKDKLFYFVGVDSQPNKTSGTANVYPGLVSSDSSTSNIKPYLKLNWYLTQDHQITVTYYGQRAKFEQTNAYSNRGTAQLGDTSHDNTDLFTLNYDWTISPDLLLSVKAGFSKLSQHDSPTDATDVNLVDNAYFSTQGPVGLAGLDYDTGGNPAYNIDNTNKTTQLSATLSWFPPHHAVKFGVSYLKSEYDLNNYAAGGYTLAISSDATPGSPVGTVGTGTLTQTFYRDNASVSAKYLALFAQDFWEFLPGLKLGYGGRYETQKQYGGNGQEVMSFTDFKDAFQPYLGLIWDVHNDGRSKLSATYRTSFEAIPQRLAMRSFGGEYYYLYNYSSNFAYDPTNPNHWGTLTGGATLATAPYQNYAALGADSYSDYSTGFSNDPIAKGTRLPRRQELVLGYDQQMGSANTFGAHFRYRKLDHIIEDSTITDFYGNPYDTGAVFYGSGSGNVYARAILWNPGPGPVTWTSNSAQSTTPGTYTVDNTLFPKAFNEYSAVDLTWEYRVNRLYSNISYTWSHLKGNYEGVVSSSNGQADGNITASFDFWSYVGTGDLPLDRTHQFKWFGTYAVPIRSNKLNLGWNLVWQSGTPVNLFDDGSATNGDPEGWDDQHYYFYAPGKIGVITAANYNNSANWTGGVIPTNGSNTGYVGSYSTFYDIGFYGNAVPKDLKLGNMGRTPTTYSLDLHADFEWLFSSRFRLVPGVDIFNAANTRKATGVYQQGTLDSFGTPNPGYGLANSYQTGRSFRFSLKFIF